MLPPKPALLGQALYYQSVGLGACLNLNVPLDRRGLIYDEDAKTLRALGKWLDETFGVNLAKGAKLTPKQRSWQR